MGLDYRVLKLLENDARMAPATMAAMLGESEAAVLDAIARLEKENIIRGYGAIINWEKAGHEGVTAMIEVKVTPERDLGFNSVATKIARFPEVRCVYLMSGTYDLSVWVEGQSLKDIANFVSHKLSTINNVHGTTTHFILKRYKQDNFIFEDADDDRRLVVS